MIVWLTCVYATLTWFGSGFKSIPPTTTSTTSTRSSNHEDEHDSYVNLCICDTHLKFEREKFYPGPGIEPGPLALRASALPLCYPGELLIQGRFNLFEPIHSDLRTTDSVVATSYTDMHSYI